MLELDNGGGVMAVHTFGPNGLLSRCFQGYNDTFYTFDPQGCSSVRTDRNANAAAADAFDGFGARRSTDGADTFSGFSGQWGGYTDGQTGLTLMTHRFYDPATGRFLTRDPAGYAGGVNLYAYCQNDPVNRTDPSGLDFTGGIGSFPVEAPGGGIYLPGTNPMNGFPVSRVFGPGGVRPGPEPYQPFGPEPLPMPTPEPGPGALPSIPPAGINPPGSSPFGGGGFICKLMELSPVLPDSGPPEQEFPVEPPQPPGITRTYNPPGGEQGGTYSVNGWTGTVGNGGGIDGTGNTGGPESGATDFGGGGTFSSHPELPEPE